MSVIRLASECHKTGQWPYLDIIIKQWHHHLHQHDKPGGHHGKGTCNDVKGRVSKKLYTSPTELCTCAARWGWQENPACVCVCVNQINICVSTEDAGCQLSQFIVNWRHLLEVHICCLFSFPAHRSIGDHVIHCLGHFLKWIPVPPILKSSSFINHAFDEMNTISCGKKSYLLQ